MESLHISLAQKYQPNRDAKISVHLFRELLDYQRIITEENQHFQNEGIRKEEHPLYRPVYGKDNRVEPDAGWEDFTGCPVSLHWIKADHVDIVKAPCVFEIARILRREIRREIDQFYGLI